MSLAFEVLLLSVLLSVLVINSCSAGGPLQLQRHGVL
jgi:hypothetical protein